MEFLYVFATITAFTTLAVNGRAVNVSTTWFLPEEGFPVFYRYFDDKLTWSEAQATCGSHHADLLSVQTSARMDAARAYLKEIEVVDSVWIGLQKNSPEERFSWTNGEELVGDGYWVEPVPKSSEKLCVALEPGADFRWNSHYCRGPEVAGFVCELPVPEWAKEKNGCLIKSLPSLTVTFVPEAGVIQLLSDCGLNGTRRIACNEKADPEEIMKRLSCDVDAFASTTFAGSTTVGAARELNTRPSDNNQIISHHTTGSYHLLTRHRRSPPSTSPPNTHPHKHLSPPPPNLPSHVFPHSPYLASERNAPATKLPPTTPPLTTPSPTPNDTAPTYKPLPVLIITGEDNNSLPSAASPDPPIVLMIPDKDLDGPFLFPLADDIIINNPSLSPIEIMSVDLVEVDNHTANVTNTNNQTSPAIPSDAPPPQPVTPHPPNPEQLLNAVRADGSDPDAPPRPNRGRSLTHITQPSFYPRLLNRVLG